MIPFAKGHGLGNDYLVFEEADLLRASTEAIVNDLRSQLGRGLGRYPAARPPAGDFGLGSSIPTAARREVPATGSDLRQDTCAITAKPPATVHGRQTPGRLSSVSAGRTTARDVVTVEMGPRDVRPPRSDDERGRRGRAGVSLSLGEAGTVTATACRRQPALRRVRRPARRHEVSARGPLIERHARSRIGPTSSSRAWRAGRDAIEIRIWERGAGYTLASGSSSCGAASAAVRNGHCDHGRISVRMPGGELVVHVRPDFTLTLEGPVEEVCTGTLAPEFEAAYVRGAGR